MWPKVIISVALITLIVLPTSDLFAHGGRFKAPVAGTTPGDSADGGSSVSSGVQKGFSFPGGGPQVAFRETMWEFWWDFHHEPLLGLRKSLFSRTPSAGVIDFPFEKITSNEKRVKVVQKLLNNLRAKEISIRAAAVVALARTRDETVLPYIELTYRKDKSTHVRTMAVLALGITRNVRAVKVLESIMNDDRELTELRLFAAVSLGLIGGENVAVVLRPYLDAKGFKKLERDLQRGVAFAAGLTLDPTLAPMVSSLLANKVDNDWITESFLVLSLGRLGYRAANPILIEYLEEGRVQVRRSAAISLGVTASPSDKDVIQALQKAADSDADLMVKNFCHIALGKVGGPEAEKYLLKVFGSTNLSRVPFVALGIGLLNNPNNGAVLLEKYKSIKDNSTRAALAVAMGLLQYTPALGELRKVVDSKTDPILRSYCAQALGMMRDVDSVERLRKSCTDSNDVELIRSTAMALGLIGDTGIYDVLVDMMDPKKSDVIRSSAAYCMGLVCDRKAIATLTELADDENIPSEIRSYAITALGLLGDENPTPVVSLITRDNNYTIMETNLYELFNIN